MATTTPDWDAAQYEAALVHLAKLQAQLDGLRSAIPGIVAPLTRPSNDKAKMYAEIRKAAVGATDDLKTFKKDWSDEKTKDIIKRGKESVGKDGNLTGANGVERWGWEEKAFEKDGK